MRSSLVVLPLILFLSAAPLVAETAGSEDSLGDAMRHFHAGELAAAEELLLASRKERPEDADVAFYLGRVYLAQGRSKQAVAELERATRLDPSSSTAQFWLAEALVERIDEVVFFFKLGIAKRMGAAYEQAVELDPENLEARIAVARYHSEAPAIAGGSAERAASELAEIERRDPAVAHLTRGLIHEQLGRLEAAEEALRQAVEADPESVLCWREAGLFYERRERWEDAQRAFDEVLAREPDDAVAWVEAARAAMAISERQLARAEAALAAYLELEPAPAPVVLSDVEPATRTEAFQKLGVVYERLGWPELAAREYQAAVELDASNEEARESLARARRWTGCPPMDAARVD